MPMSRRIWMVSLSVAAHLALGVGVFVSGAWKLERLDPERPSLAVMGVMTIGEPAGSPAPAAPKVELTRKPKPQVVKDLVQIANVEPAKPAEQPTDAVTTDGGTGNGEGEGQGSGRGRGALDGGGCLLPPCAAAQPPLPTPPAPPAPAVPRATMVPPQALTAMWLSGERQVVPAETTKQQMLRDGRRGTKAALKVCVSETGAVSSVTLLMSSQYADYDARLVAATRGWRYRPYTIAGRPAPACGVVTFVFTLR